MTKPDALDLLKLARDLWPFWEPTDREEREFGEVVRPFAFNRGEDALRAHRDEHGRSRHPGQAPEFPALRRLLAVGTPKSDRDRDFEAWFYGQPPHHLIDGHPNQTACTIRRLFYQRDHDRRRLQRADFREGLGPDRLEHRIALDNDRLQDLRELHPEHYAAGAASYAASGHAIYSE